MLVLAAVAAVRMICVLSRETPGLERPDLRRKPGPAFAGRTTNEMRAIAAAYGYWSIVAVLLPVCLTAAVGAVESVRVEAAVRRAADSWSTAGRCGADVLWGARAPGRWRSARTAGR